MLTNVIIVPIPITRQGQKVFFEVAIPKDVNSIIGIEASITGLSGITLVEIIGRQVAGMIKLQAEGTANQCYSTQVHVGISSLDKNQPGFNPTYTSWQQNSYVGSYNREPEQVRIGKTNTIYGSYTDIYGKRISRDLVYTAGLYLWTERKDN